MEQGIFHILVENGTSERLDEIAMRDEAYQKASQELDDAILEKESLTGKLQEADRRISVLYGSLMAAYARLAYEQGLKDMAEIFAKSLKE